MPFVIGPLNGGVPWPKGFDQQRRQEKEWLSYIRGAYKLLPGYRATRKYTNTIIVGSLDTYAQVPQIYHKKCTYIAENAIDPSRFPHPGEKPAPSSPLKAAFVGRLVPYKGADMLIEAAADQVKARRLEVDVYGDGPEMPRLKAMVQQHAMADTFRLHGQVPHTELHSRLKQADIFTFPSIREFGGAVALEAMAVGVVPIVVGYGGPNELVTDDTGYRLKIDSRQKIIAELQDLLQRLTDDPSPLIAMRENGLKRVQDLFTWDAKAKQVCEIYQWARSGSNGPRPQADYGFKIEPKTSA